MKTDRSSATRTAAVLLAGLFLAAGGLDAGQRFHRGSLVPDVKDPQDPQDPSKAHEARTRKLAQALAREVGEVQQRFAESRRALHTVKGRQGEPAYLPQDVASLVDSTEKDLDQAITRVGDSGLEPLRAWSAEKLRPIQEGLAASAGHTAGLLPGLFAPRAVAVVASLGRLPLPEPESANAAAPKKKAPKKAPKQAPKPAAPLPEPPPPPTIPAEKANSLLDQVGEVVGRIFFLASHEDLEVKLWVGSTERRATFSFWSQGQIQGPAPAPPTIRTDGTKEHVLRGLYQYKAVHAEGAVADIIQYPNPAGAPAAQTPSEQLDLVNGSSFFCCRFNEQYCHHVANEKECHS